jgi:glycerol uptake facilitator-like aquaporin
MFAAHLPGFGATSEGYSSPIFDAGHDLTEIAVGTFGLCAAVLALALVQRWGQRFPRPFIALPALIGGIAAAGYGFTGIAYQSLIETGVLTAPEIHNATSSFWWFYWFALFAAMGTAFILTVWLTRKGRAERGVVEI